MSERRRQSSSSSRSDPVREALRRASLHGEPDIDRLIDAVPEMLAEAQRRRRVALMPAARISSVAHFWLPRLAAATVILLAAALVWPRGSSGDRSHGTDSGTSIETWIVTGK